jgi:Putative auto-transporter adhesin, head GIN domain
MKKLWVLLAAATSIVSLPSCEKVIGKGPVVTQDRDVHSFQKFSLSVDAEVHFTQSNDYSLEIDAQQNILDQIESVVAGNELKIGLRHSINISNSERIVIRVSAPEVNSFIVSGSGDIDIQQPDAPANLNLAISGSGSIEADQAGISYVESNISGSGRIEVAGGHPNSNKATISGSGYIDMQNVQVKESETRISGSGTIKVYATQKLNAHISGSGTVYYKGTPTISSSTSGSGSVVPL